MSGQLLDGKILAAQIKDQLRKEVEDLRRTTGAVPHLVNIIVGNDPASLTYANSQKKVAEQVGIQYALSTLPADVSQAALIEHIKKHNADDRITGIMISKPLPATINYRQVTDCVDVRKDLEGVNVANIGKLIVKETKIIPCTPAAVMEHLRSIKVSLRGKEAVIVGQSEIVGKPLALLLLGEHATVTVCHRATSEAGHLIEHCKRADILVVAVGKPGFIKGEWVKSGALVVDVGINHVGDKIVGDVEFEPAQKRAAYITPVPGGVGPVTVVMLMRNGIEAYKLQTPKKGRV